MSTKPNKTNQKKKKENQKVKQTPTKLWNSQPQAVLGYHVKLR